MVWYGWRRRPLQGPVLAPSVPDTSPAPGAPLPTSPSPAEPDAQPLAAPASAPAPTRPAPAPLRRPMPGSTAREISSAEHPAAPSAPLPASRVVSYVPVWSETPPPEAAPIRWV